MKTILLMALLWPGLAMAQEVKPVLSADYLALIKNDSVLHATIRLTDSTNSMKIATARLAPESFGSPLPVRKITTNSNGTVSFKPLTNNYISFAGNASVKVEMQQVNSQPRLQNDFAQGRNANGMVQWNGPATGEMFSYGPALQTLEYTGVADPYDINGQLVAKGMGNGRAVNSYNNSIFRNAFLVTNGLALSSKYYKNSLQVFNANIRAGHGYQQSIFRGNQNTNNYFSFNAGAVIKGFSINGSYNYMEDKFNHNNRNGFLNRVYQNSLLTPASFDNSQGKSLSTVQQRSYATQADNPAFLMADASHGFLQQQYTGNLLLMQKFKKLQLRLSQSIERLGQQSNEGLQAGTAFYPTGIVVGRRKTDDNYVMNANASYNVSFAGRKYKAVAMVNYLLKNNRSVIDYNHSENPYRYQRNSHDVSVSFAPEFDGYKMAAKLVLANNMYASNTNNRNRFFLPAVSGFVRFDRLFEVRYLSLKFTGSFNRFDSELPINQSLATASQVQYSVGSSLQYLPLIEVDSYKGLDPIQHREYNGGIEIQYDKIWLSANIFNRRIAKDIFPVTNGSRMALVNMATHRNSGIEVSLGYNPYYWRQNKLSLTNTIGFIAYKSKVLNVKDGYNFTALAGFKEVHKVLAEGESLGAIAGNTWMRNADNQLLIGTDGFPLVHNNLSVIGNAIPDFTMKFSHHVSYRGKWNLNIDWEWKKGGDVWNGTQAMLDYYGRSANSGSQRNLINYVFDGVHANGSHNTVPVSFYNPALPLEQNRWVRYGAAGVAESYIEKGDCIRFNNIGISYRHPIKKYLQQLTLALYTNNVIVWSAYKGADPNQLLNDQPGSAGLDFFNLPSTQSFGFTASLQF